MRDVLLDIIKQTSTLMEVVKVIGNDNSVAIEGVDKDKVLLVHAETKQPIPEFVGEFGLTNMGLLNGLLNFSNYQSDDATFTVKHKTVGNRTFTEELKFSNKVTGNSSDFRFMSADLVPQQGVVGAIPWTVQIPVNRAKVAEFQQLAQMYAEVSKSFGIRTTPENNLEFFIGDFDDSSHRVTMVFASDITGEIPNGASYIIQNFISVMKLAGTNPATLSISNRGALSVKVETPHAFYTYYLRANR